MIFKYGSRVAQMTATYANKYIDDILTQSESALQAALTDVRKTKQAVRNVPSNTGAVKK